MTPGDVVAGAVLDALKRKDAHFAALERVAACLLDHYLTDYGMNDDEPLAGQRDALSAEAEKLMPNWRASRDEWKPRQHRKHPMERIVLSPKDFEALVKALDNPPAPNAALKELMRRKAPWTK